MFYLPDFNTCKKIAETNEAFIHKTVEVKGYKFHLFNYLLAQYNDFLNPLEDDNSVTAFELRGLTFLEHEGEYTRSLALHKFFNINQCQDYMYDDLKDCEIVSIQDKRDGSMIRFVRLPNGEIVAKTKMDFDNIMTETANKLLAKDKDLYEFVSETLDAGLAAIFEITSPALRIVLMYSETKLTLLQLRDESTGEYLDIRNHDLVNKYNIALVDNCPKQADLDYYLKEREIILGIEGWIFTIKDKNGYTKLFKVKTTEYVRKHGLLTDTFSRENKLIQIILDEKVDDVLGELDKEDPRREVLVSLSDSLSKYINHEVHNIYDFFKREYEGDRKEFALKNNKHEYFPLAVKAVGLNDEGEIQKVIYDNYRLFISRNTNKLERARVFLEEKMNFKLIDHFVSEDVE